MIKHIRNRIIILLSILVFACNNNSSNNNKKVEESTKEIVTNDKPLFTLLNPSQTGLTFKNRNIENDALNFYKYEYFYNGGGVAVADFNNDGLQDVIFTANMGFNKLFLNKGNLKFEDITQTANVNSGERDWCTGVTIVDVNSDGWQDIFISRSGWFKGDSKSLLRNLLFVNNGDLTFTEMGSAYGFDDLSPTTQACFFDADNDGDLDVYQINHPTIFKTFQKYQNGELVKINSPENDFSDRFYLNVNGKFVDKTSSFGFENSGHGLGVISSDFNNDGWQDIYVSNDYLEPDYIYMNQKDGTFKNEAFSAFKHISKFSMGVDVADINNDGFQDIFNAEMLAPDNFSKKANMAPMDVDSYWTYVENGLHYQDMHNSLQLNNANGTFSEISWLSGVAETDWSWCPLLADFDNDGYKDLFVSNGYKREVLSKDFTKKLEKMMKEKGTMRFSEFSNLIPYKKVSNVIFKNNGNLTFTDKTNDWGIKFDVNTNGAAYADFDNDGDLDIVLNNIEDDAILLENNLNKKSNYLSIELKNGLDIPYGTIVKILDSNNKQTFELKNARGYQSFSQPKIHIGLGNIAKVDSLEINWADGKKSLLTDVKVNKELKIDYKSSDFINFKDDSENTIFKNITDKIGISYSHKEQEFDDYEREVLLPHKLSQEGPFFDVADVNNDGLDDFFVGNGVGYSGELYVQEISGKFKRTNLQIFEKDKLCEDLGVLFFDADSDGDQDLYVVSGSNEYELDSPYMQDRLYINDGKGNFDKSTDRLPSMKTSGLKVTSGDIDNDGDLDLFIGGYLDPGNYPKQSPSFLLENQEGVFKDVTESISKDLSTIGMVKDAVFSDMNNDNKLDLIVTGHWMPIEVFINSGDEFIRKTEDFRLSDEIGWWNTLSVEDVDNDGFKDIIAGNLGTNTKHKASKSQPFKVYAKDFDQSGTNDVVLGYYSDGNLYPVRGKQCSAQQLPEIDDKIESYNEFGSLRLEQIYGQENLNDAISYDATNFKTSFFRNIKGDKFNVESLPNYTQFAPTNGIVSIDINKDNKLDLILVGNHFPIEVETGRYDAHTGNVLLSDNKTGEFKNVSHLDTGFFTDSDCRDVKPIIIDGKPSVIVSSNRNRLQFFSLQ